MQVLKTLGYVLMILVGLAAATGVGIIVSALSSIIGFALLGAVAIVFIVAAVKEFFDC